MCNSDANANGIGNTGETVAVLLLAGLGSRLGKPIPKCLNQLNKDETILSRQLRILKSFNIKVIAVVGFKKELVMEAAPDLLFAYNSEFDTTNTSKSLLCALRYISDANVLWINGDVVFEEGILRQVLQTSGSVVAVNNASVGEEEIKYTVNSDGFINAISKKVEKPLGEALGINLIAREHVDKFKQCLQQVADDDYFERAMELLIGAQANVFRALDVSEYACVEVDFGEDLLAAKQIARHAQDREKKD